MFELLLKPVKIEHHPILMGLLAFFSVSIAVILSFRIFPESSSIILICFTIIPIIPIMVKLIELEEIKLEQKNSFFKKHAIINIYCWYFIGLICAFLLWFLILPAPTSQQLFSDQIDAIYDFRGPTGFATYEFNPREDICDNAVMARYQNYNCVVADFNKDYISEYVFYAGQEPVYVVEPQKLNANPSYEPTPYKQYLLKIIFQNNVRILLFAILTSFIFGAGALFIITWNASIVGVFFAQLLTQGVNLVTITGFFLHGIPEFLSFFFGGIAGGIISIAMIRHHPNDEAFKRVITDAFIFGAISLVLLVVAAVLEVYV